MRGFTVRYILRYGCDTLFEFNAWTLRTNTVLNTVIQNTVFEHSVRTKLWKTQSCHTLFMRRFIFAVTAPKTPTTLSISNTIKN